MTMLSMTELDLAGKKVLIRQDLNVPLKAGQVADDSRIKASLQTIELALAAGAKVMIMSHLGRPAPGEYDQSYSLRPVADCLAHHLGKAVLLATDWLDGIDMTAHDVVLCENVRFQQGELEDDPQLAKKMAALCDVYVMDAFGTAHRAHASTHGVAEYAPIACAGPLLMKELTALSQALDTPVRPVVAIVGGSKVSSKLTVLTALSKKVDQLIVGGGIANTFIAASGHDVGGSLYEEALLPTCQTLTEQAQRQGGEIPIPVDVVCGDAFSESAVATLKPVDAVSAQDMIFDIGPESVEQLVHYIEQAGTIVWNGPLGVFEFTQFGQGTERIAKAIAKTDAFSIAGGGDTIAAINQYQIADEVSYISTGGGAFLEFLEGKTLPAVNALTNKAS
ncbi:MAG TPA: phosphoglycerate kinase [Gammaproteobacteria bacterium]|nr:phosphoglycerate kinase [Gammaproteobacteria bacterium]HAU06231.1 phosphoglycerate kinase [Gammaproteobacteria bacterium]